MFFVRVRLHFFLLNYRNQANGCCCCCWSFCARCTRHSDWQFTNWPINYGFIPLAYASVLLDPRTRARASDFVQSTRVGQFALDFVAARDFRTDFRKAKSEQKTRKHIHTHNQTDPVHLTQRSSGPASQPANTTRICGLECEPSKRQHISLSLSRYWTLGLCWYCCCGSPPTTSLVAVATDDDNSTQIWPLSILIKISSAPFGRLE